MKQKKENQHMIDALFVITLFCLFAISAIILIAVGAKVYKNTIQHMETHFTTNTALSYITEKIRQNDRKDAVSVCPFGDGNAFVFTQDFHGESYCTYIYQDEGNIKELFAKADFQPDIHAGQNILPVKKFFIQQEAEHLYKIILVDQNNQTSSVVVHIKSK